MRVIESLDLDCGLQEDVADIYLRLHNKIEDYCLSIDLISNSKEYITKYNDTFNFLVK